jgi:RHS repeat-associated protein
MNGQEKDDDIADGVFSAQYWEYDSRIGRRWNVDPVDQVNVSNYACFRNNPIRLVDPNGMEPKPGDRKKYEEKFKKKIGSVLEKMHQDGKSPKEIRAKANALADKYQNKAWFRAFAPESKELGGSQANQFGGRSKTTGWVRSEHLSIDPYPAPTTIRITARDGSANEALNNTSLPTGLVAEKGATVTAVFNPKSEPDALTVTGTYKHRIEEELLTSGGEVRSSDNAQKQSFSYSTVTTSGPLSISVKVGNTQEASVGHDNWNLSITVQNPFTVDPYKLVHSNVKAHAGN